MGIEDVRKASVVDEPAAIDYEYCIPACARCCTPFGVTEEFAQGISEKYGLDIDEFTKVVNKKRYDSLQLKQENGRCIFVNEQNLCAIYEDRPKICRAFSGFFIKEWLDDENFACYKDLIMVFVEELRLDLSVVMKRVWIDFRNVNGYSSEDWLKRADRVFMRCYEFRQGADLAKRGVDGVREGIKEVLLESLIEEFPELSLDESLVQELYA